MAVLDIVLRDDALVGDPLLIQEVRGDGLLQKRITDVLLVRQDLPERAGRGPFFVLSILPDPLCVNGRTSDLSPTALYFLPQKSDV